MTVTGADAATAESTRWGIVGVTAAATGLGASLGFIPGFVATAMRDDLGISRAEVGLLVSVHFGCTGVGSILAGRLTERVGARLAVALDMALVALSAVFVALVGTYWALMVAAVIGGFGYAITNVGSNVAVARAVPFHRRTVAMSLKTAGVPTMALVGAALSPWAADQWRWEVVYVVAALLAAATTIMSMVALPQDRPVRATTQPSRALPQHFVWFSIGAFMLVGGTQPMYSWFVPYLEEGLDSSPALAGTVASIATGFGVVVMIANGLGADRVGADKRVPLLVTLSGVTCLATLVILSGLSIGLAGAIVGATLGIATQLAAIGTMHAAILDRAPEAISRATGVTMTGYYLGALVSPVGFGGLIDLTDTYAWSWLAMAIMVALGTFAFARTSQIPVAK